MHIRIKCTDTLGNVSYIYSDKDGSGPYCALANGLGATFHYAGIPEKQYMELRFAFEDADTPDDFMAWVRAHGSSKYERIK
jgi:hypothetical protein